MTAGPPAGPYGPSDPYGQVDAPPRCYRHPERETYIRCQRCNRPICPDCQIPAAVGVQCPECVREAGRTVPRPRTTFGGTAADQPLATFTIIGLCVLGFVLQQIGSLDLTDRFSMIGYAIDGQQLVGVADGEYYRLITASFLHDPSNPLHVGVNMFSLYILGPPLERLLGRSRFVALYLVSALGGGAVSYLLNAANDSSVGASGAIFGLFGALVVVSRKMQYDLRPILGIIGVNAVIGFVLPNIDWRAHLGGLITGALVAVAMVYAPKDRRTLVQVGGTALVLVLVALVVVVRTNALTG